MKDRRGHSLVIQSVRGHAADIAAAVLVLAYAAFAGGLAVRQHESFHTHAFDMAYFDNVMWNTSQGRLFANDLPDKPRIFLGEHVSPALIILAPLYWLWPDARALLAAQAVALALTVVPAYLVVRKRYPFAALMVMVALFLNPALLGVALSEFHEISLAAPLLAWALWALIEGRTRVLIACLVGALLAKEEVAVVVAAVGTYLLLVGRISEANGTCRRTRLLGVAFAAGALAWLGFVWGVLPSLLPEAVSHWRMRYGDIAPTPWQGALRLATDPGYTLGRLAVPAKLAAVLRVLAPLAFVPLAAPALAALALPVLGYLLMSSKHSVSELQVWYVTPLLPILFIAAAQAIARAPRGGALAMSGAMLLASLWGYWQFGEGPLASAYEPARFAVSARTDCGHRLLSLIPPQASVSALDNLLPHLAHRQALWVFPSMGEPLAEYVAIDANYENVGGYANWPLVRRLEVPAYVSRFLSDPSYDLIGDGCEYKVLRHTGTPIVPNGLSQTFGAQIDLIGYDVAVRGDEGIYRPARAPWPPNSAVRVTLWWRPRGSPVRDYTVFVHALDAEGRLAGQHDSQPANGARPTSQWHAGELVRDIHYLDTGPNVFRYSVGLYDATTGQRLVTAAGADHVGVPLSP